jgi:hypothetical protein
VDVASGIGEREEVGDVLGLQPLNVTMAIKVNNRNFEVGIFIVNLKFRFHNGSKPRRIEHSSSPMRHSL